MRRGVIRRGFACFLLALGVTTCSSAGGAASITPPPCGLGGPAHYDHVVWIVLENVGYSVVGSPSAPYFNSLASACGLATHDVAVSHPSLSNYVALTSGSTQGITDDAEPGAHVLGSANVFSQLGGRWRALVESMPSPCDKVTSGSYAARHNPAVYYRDLASTCATHDVALRFPLDLSASFTFIAPNICDDMHSCPVATGDAWLRRAVGSILRSSAYKARSLVVFVTFDENDSSSSNQVPTLVLAPTVPRGVRVAAAFNHYSLLRTTEDLLGLAPLGNARSANSMVVPFHL